jgi:hypothetical protein
MLFADLSNIYNGNFSWECIRHTFESRNAFSWTNQENILHFGIMYKFVALQLKKVAQFRLYVSENLWNIFINLYLIKVLKGRMVSCTVLPPVAEIDTTLIIKFKKWPTALSVFCQLVPVFIKFMTLIRLLASNQFVNSKI